MLNNNFYGFQAYIKKDFMSVSAKIKCQSCGFLVASEENELISIVLFVCNRIKTYRKNHCYKKLSSLPIRLHLSSTCNITEVHL